VSTDPLRRLVTLMAQLRAECSWTAEQDHASLAPYAIEEAYELAEAAESGDREALRDELGDLLLQVVFHSAVAAEHEAEPFDIDDVALALTRKLVRRHPHVFSPDVDEEGQPVELSPEDIERAWQRIKESEAPPTPAAPDPFADIPAAAPALSRAQKVARRLRRRGDAPEELLRGPEGLGRDLMALVLRAEAGGLDVEAELRGYLRELGGR